MQLRTWMVVTGLALGGCGGKGAPGSTPGNSGGSTALAHDDDTCETAATGDVSMVQTATGAGTRYTTPQEVPGKGSDAGGYIEVAGAAGGTREMEFTQGCRELPAVTDLTSCPVIEPGTLAQEVWRELEARGVTGLNGIGLGVGGDVATNTLAGWHFSIGVSNWADADVAIQVVGAILDSYQVRTAMGVSVHGTDCAVLLGGE